MNRNGGKLSMISRRQFCGGLIPIATLLATEKVLEKPALALGGKLPELNVPAPGFCLPSNGSNQTLALEDYRGRWVVLYFYPKDFTSGCTLEARRFQRDLPQYLALNTQVIGVSADDVQSHAEFCDAEGLVFPLLADVDGSVSRAYGSWLAPYSLRHTFIIDPEGILRERFLAVRPATHSLEVLDRLKVLQEEFHG
jgi:peroxiredoxin Q/BCP